MFYEWCVFLIFPFLMIYAGISDALSFTISNKVSLALLAGFVVLAPFSGMAMAEIGVNVLVGFVTLIVGFILFARGIIGGADAKIMAVAALWLGPQHVGFFLLLVGLFGGVLSLFFLHIRKTPLPPLLAGQRWLLNFQVGEAAVPYGVAIGCAAIAVYPYSQWMGLS